MCGAQHCNIRVVLFVAYQLAAVG